MLKRILKRVTRRRKTAAPPDDVYRVEFDGKIIEYRFAPRPKINYHDGEHITFLTDISDRQ